MPLQKTRAVEEIRAMFPALQRIHNGYPVAYFDGPGGTQVPLCVVDAMTDYLLRHNANTHWDYPTSHETDSIIAAARSTLAYFLNASADEIAFGQNMTTLTLHLARTLAREWQAGDEIIVTDLDHHANIDTWRSLEAERDIALRHLPFDTETGLLEMDLLPGLFTEKTKLLAIGAASNALGTMPDVAHACRLAREAGALSFVDAVHFAAHNLIDTQAIGCDFLACSAYKFYGPHIGILFGRKELLERLRFPKLRPAPDYAPENVETGTQSHESIAGAAAAVEFLASLSGPDSGRAGLAATFQAMHERQGDLTRKLWDGLRQVGGVKVYGPAPAASPRTSTISFTVKGVTSAEVARRLSETGIFVSHGDFYAATVVEKLGLSQSGLVRAGCACYTTWEEVERLLAGVAEIARSG
jgi:cysteine desulfurase family protein (TIGR01976 family)